MIPGAAACGHEPALGDEGLRERFLGLTSDTVISGVGSVPLLRGRARIEICAHSLHNSASLWARTHVVVFGENH